MGENPPPIFEPVWKRPGWITSMVAVVSVSLTVPQIFGDYLSKKQDIEAARLKNVELKQSQEFRVVKDILAHLGEERVFVLRYLKVTHDQDDVRHWASNEVARLEDIAQKNKQLTETQQEISKLKAELALRVKKGEEDNAALEGKIQALQKNLEDKDADVAELRQKAGISTAPPTPEYTIIEVHVSPEAVQTEEGVDVQIAPRGGSPFQGLLCGGKTTCKFPVVGPPPEALVVNFKPEGAVTGISATYMKRLNYFDVESRHAFQKSDTATWQNLISSLSEAFAPYNLVDVSYNCTGPSLGSLKGWGNLMCTNASPYSPP